MKRIYTVVRWRFPLRGLGGCVLAFSLFLLSCSPTNFITKTLKHSSDSLHHHTGFVLYDPIKKKNIISINGDKYFTPASNAKIFTLYAGLKILGDSVPALRYLNRNDSLIFWGTGDPSFLYPDVFQNGRVYSFLKSAKSKLYISPSNFQDDVYGPGWSWADYMDYYQVERSSLPMYGNLLFASRGKGVEPKSFQSNIVEDNKASADVWRDRFSNKFIINPTKLPKTGKSLVPFITSDSLLVKLLSDTLKRDVLLAHKKINTNSKTLYSIPIDSIYKVMMHVSDNFIAEQILMVCSQKISDSLSADIVIKKVKKDFFADAPDAFVWVDGSGLSRYNQFTPRTIIKLWEKIYSIVPQERLFPLLVSNGNNGTLRNMLKDKPAFIFGKTGSLANNYCLSGYLVTKKNHLLIFSSMNANFVSGTKPIRDNLAKTLLYIYEHY